MLVSNLLQNLIARVIERKADLAKKMKDLDPNTEERDKEVEEKLRKRPRQ